MNIIDRTNGWLRRLPPWMIYVVAPMPAVWWFWLGLTGGLGPEPINALERELGRLALKLLIVTLAITPLRRHVGLNLIRFRRAIGLTAFFYLCLHLSAWLFLDIQDWSRIWADIVKRPYVTIGMAGFALMVPLALTSNNLSVRRLGPAWRRLHRLTYLTVLLGATHYVMLVKGWQVKPLVYFAIVAVLLLLRLRFSRPQRVAA